MTYDEFNKFCASLPATTHVVQWGGAHVWKVGGKVFAIGGWHDDHPAFTFKVSRDAYEVLVAQSGVRPAPYLASRGMSWVQQHAPGALSDEALMQLLEESHRIVATSLTKKAKRELGLSNP